MRVLDLFSGIGGFSLGLERAGMKTVAFCEIEPYCRAVLAKHWPNVPCYGDIRELTAERLRADGISVDLICGGFPCQDISVAGKGAGLAGERSGLWSEYARLVSELRPRFVIVENVAALLNRGLAEVLGGLAEIGYDSEWHCIPASHVSAPHRRDRIWIIGHPQSLFSDGGDLHGGSDRESPREGQEIPQPKDLRSALAHPKRDGGESDRGLGQLESSSSSSESGKEERQRLRDAVGGGRETVADADGAQRERDKRPIRIFAEHPDTSGGGWWASEPNVGRVAHGIPARVDRLRALGNAVVPQIPEIIGRAIMRLT